MKLFKSNFLKPKHRRKKIILLLISIFHSFFLLSLGYIWLGMSYTFGDEAFLIKWTSLIKKEMLSIDPKPPPSDVLFINTSQSKAEIEVNTDPLSIQPVKMEITDRKQIAQILQLMAPFKNEIRLVVLDILFDVPSKDDSVLQQQFYFYDDKVLGVSHFKNKETYLKPVLHFPYALATYRSAAGMYFKYPVIYRGIETLPTSIYEKLTGNKIIKKGLFFRDGEKLSLKAPITDFKVRMSDFQLGSTFDESNYAFHHLETLTMLGPMMEPADLKKLFAGKLILIGNFDSDIHKTAFGMMPGLLIVYNAYLTLLNNENVVNKLWLLLMIAGFTFISYRLFSGHGFNLLDLVKRRFKSGWILFILNSLDEFLFLSLLTVISYLFFNILINILVLFIYLKIIEFIIDILKPKLNLQL